MSNINKLDVAYPKNEKAVTLVFSDDFPIKYLFIGITFPLSTYKILRNGNSDETLLEFVLDGEGEIVINRKKHPLKKGDVFVLNNHSRHDYHSNTNNPLKKIWISFKSEYLEKMLEDYKISSGVYQVNVENQFRAVYEIANTQNSPQNKIFAIADNLHQIITTLARKNTLSVNDSFSAIKNELLSCVYSSCSLETICEKLYISKSNLIRIFKKQTGITPYAFLINEKLSVAETLLLTTDMTVKAISELLCFSDGHYFSYIFKQKTGKTPTEYRKPQYYL